MRIHRRSTYTRPGRRRIAPVAISLASGLALIGGVTIASAVGVAPIAAAATSHFTAHAQTSHIVQPKGQPAATDNSTHLNQTPPSVNETPHVVAHTAINQTFTVNTQNDTTLATPGSTTCLDSDGNCSLRAAVQAADNDYPNVDAINVPAGYDILLNSSNDAIDVTNSMFISGVGGGAAPVIDGQGATEDFDVYSNSSTFVPAVQMGDLTIQGGSSSEGGDIWLGDNAADLTLSSVTVTGGTASSAGGGIYVYNDSSLWTDAGTFITNNTAPSASGDCGGGIYSRGSVVVSGSTISGNTAGCGGGIYNDGVLSLDAAQIDNNSATEGGALYNTWSMSDNGSSYNGNAAGTSTSPVDTPEGAVLYNEDAASLNNVTVSGSQSWSNGTDTYGGVFYNIWQLGLTNVSVADSTNRADGGTIYGGVIDNDAVAFPCYLNAYCIEGGNLSVSGLDVSGTTNGVGGVDTSVQGGVIFNDDKASVNGLTVSSTTNTTGTGVLYGGVGEVSFYFLPFDCCPQVGPDVSGSTSYLDVNVTGTTNVGSGDYYEGGVFDTSFDFWSSSPLSGNITNGTISGTSDTVLGTGDLYGGVVGSISTTALDNLSIDSTTVNANGGNVYGGAVATIYDQSSPYTGSEPDASASDVSVTNSDVTNVGGGNGYVEGGAWYNSDELNATGLQVLGTTATSDDYVNGAALSNDGDGTNITNSTFAGSNVAMQGATGAELALTLAAPTNLTNVTLDDNTLSSGAGSDVVYVESGASTFTNVTMANNNPAGGEGGDGIYADDAAHFKNTIVETNGGPNCEVGSGSLTSNGGNLEGGGNTCNFTQPSDQVNVANVGVSPTANNGGPVQTAALQPGSPAIGKGVSAGCPTTDARGVARPSGSCDVGAFQLSKQGYWMVASDGGLFAFANAGFYGSMGGIPLNSPIVGMAVTPDGKGYWEVASDGGIFTFGDATYYGSMGGRHLNKPIVGMAATPDGKGYWEVATDGGIFSFGDAAFYGSTGAIHLNKPIVGMAAVPGGGGYWLVASDGGIFSYGPNAAFYGSAGAIHLNKPVVGMAATPSGNGYWLVASDGGIFTYGPGAAFYGSTGAIHLNKPVVGMAATPSGDGYWLFASDGGVFNYGDATFQGSMGGTPLQQPVVGGAANPID